jgi:D-alanyl-lipoteichoic acid acyltransferase DltB (MBOAT superfamily)
MPGGITNISLAGAEFWICALAGIVAIKLSPNPVLKRVSFFIVNIVFLALLLAPLPIIVFGIVFFVLNFIKDRLYVLLTVILGILFVAHKRPDLVHSLQLRFPTILDSVHIELVNPILAMLGFSYLMLRVIELAVAVFEKRHPAPGLVDTVNYLVPFHMIAMGPIQSYDDFIQEKDVIDEPLSFDDALQAVERIARGLFKKFVLAYFIDSLLLTGFQSDGWYLLFEIQVFAFWIYLDFSAYMDVVIGLGKLMGISTPENFNRPYLARNITVFWERWHITLSMFIRRNIFVPIQLYVARKTRGMNSLLPASLAFLVSFVFCGIWHGLTWKFFVWGLLHALALIICNAYRTVLRSTLTTDRLKRYSSSFAIRSMATILTFEFIAFSFYVAFYPVRYS